MKWFGASPRCSVVNAHVDLGSDVLRVFTFLISCLTGTLQVAMQKMSCFRAFHLLFGMSCASHIFQNEHCTCIVYFFYVKLVV